MKNSIDSLIKLLYECAAACQKCVSGCLEEDADKMKACIITNLDCADICIATATFLARNSIHGKHLITECIEICRACAIECEKHRHQHCIDCAIACRECVIACEAFRGSI